MDHWCFERACTALPFEKSTTVIVVEDSKTGWAKAYRELLAMLWAGQVPAIDVSKLRPAGARLKTMGGRSSGPQPLINLFDFTIAKFRKPRLIKNKINK